MYFSQAPGDGHVKKFKDLDKSESEAITKSDKYYRIIFSSNFGGVYLHSTSFQINEL